MNHSNTTVIQPHLLIIYCCYLHQLNPAHAMPTVQHMCDHNVFAELPSYSTMRIIPHHYIDNFLDTKRRNDDEIKTCFLIHIVSCIMHVYKQT